MNIKTKIFEILKNKKAGIKRKELLSAINWSLSFEGKNISDRKLRQTVSDMIEEGYPIGSSTKRGYFLCLNQEDVNQGTELLHKRAMAELHREKKLKDNAERYNGKQFILPGMAAVADIVREEIEKEIEKC